ncbi:MAG: hypothetical protein M1827_007622 [Pycnora praestabilis]|nr:MAG: hypothetical protein M1827_007622 [Pycnora praestabilis]
MIAENRLTDKQASFVAILSSRTDFFWHTITECFNVEFSRNLDLETMRRWWQRKKHSNPHYQYLQSRDWAGEFSQEIKDAVEAVITKYKSHGDGKLPRAHECSKRIWNGHHHLFVHALNQCSDLTAREITDRFNDEFGDHITEAGVKARICKRPFVILENNTILPEFQQDVLSTLGKHCHGSDVTVEIPSWAWGYSKEK